MKGRAYVMIFFFWALLTIITPMLVSWSQSLKEQKIKDLDSGPRRMMRYSTDKHLKKEIVDVLKEEEEELMMEPSMAPKPNDKLNMSSADQKTPISFMRIQQHEGSIPKHIHTR